MGHRPQHGEVLVSAEQVTEGIRALAEFTVERYGRDKEKPLFVALLRGAMPFASRLMDQIARLDPSFHPEVDYMTVSTYGDGREAKEPRVVMDVDKKTRVGGRRVVLLDDMLDKGVTADFVSVIFRKRGAEAVDLAVLTTKDTTRDVAFADKIDGIYSCFDVPDVWITGMGMDDERVAREGNRHLPLIAVALDAN